MGKPPKRYGIIVTHIDRVKVVRPLFLHKQALSPRINTTTTRLKIARAIFYTYEEARTFLSIVKLKRGDKKPHYNFKVIYYLEDGSTMNS